MRWREGFLGNVAHLFASLGCKWRIAVLVQDDVVVEPCGAEFVLADIELGHDPFAFCQPVPDLAIGAFQFFLMFLHFLGELASNLLDEFFGLFERITGILRSPVAAQLSLNSEEMGHELVFAAGEMRPQIAVVLVRFDEITFQKICIRGGQSRVVGQFAGRVINPHAIVDANRVAKGI